ncbi:hypothetical protein N431DRAFT_461801 [Stipitochalara longipes BDJ]|nr:hypothetical protein N431DRAFT_461801 [Stipitochalara longipes BDJ]
MSPRSNKSMSDFANNSDVELPSSAFDVKPSRSSAPDADSSNKKARQNKQNKGKGEKEKSAKPEKPRLSKEEREKLKRIVTIGTEAGVGFSNRKMTKKEKKCLLKGKKKMEKLVKREDEQEDNFRVEAEQKLGS